MKSFIALVGLALSLATSVSAQTTDQDWSGRFYGLSLGYVNGTSNHSWVGTPQGVDVSANGGTFGADYGQNFQRGNLVFGYLASLNLSKADGFSLGVNTPCVTTGEACNSEMSAFATLNGRVGMALSGGFMPYLSLGVAAAKISASADTGACAGTPCTIDKTLTGYSVGVGVEKKMQNGWNLTADYSYMKFGDEQMEGSSAGGDVKAKFDYGIVSIGFSRRF